MHSAAQGLYIVYLELILLILGLASCRQAGRLDLDGLITGRRPLEQINEALDDLRASRGIRTVLSI